MKADKVRQQHTGAPHITSRQREFPWGKVYWYGYCVTAVLWFLGLWLACTVTASFLGFLLGWIPSAIAAGILSLVWPLWWILLIALAFYIVAHL